jgi:hypothetical protein
MPLVVRGPKKRKKVKIAFKAPSNHCYHTQTPHRSYHSSHGALLFWRLVPDEIKDLCKHWSSANLRIIALLHLQATV